MISVTKVIKFIVYYYFTSGFRYTRKKMIIRKGTSKR